MKILLVQPEFPVPNKSINHSNFLPIGLLKIATYYREDGNKIKLVRGNKSKKELRITGEGLWYSPDIIMITSLFTYWSEYVISSSKYYKELFPNAELIVGGIYASLMPEDCKKRTGCDTIFEGIFEEAEKCTPAYDLIDDIDYQILHTSRGCEKRCKFCGSWKIETKFEPKNSIKNEIIFKKLIFYDNNLLANPYIEKILNELIELKKDRKISWCESQCGFDGEILIEKPHLAEMIRKAGFRYPRIAWDWHYDKHPEIKKQIDLLIDAGYRSKDIFVFVLFNWDISFNEMEKKRIKCWEWRVQIADCRYRPLDQKHDYYNGSKNNQTDTDYYIHPKWSDSSVKSFRRNIRKQNICIRQDIEYYSADIERKRLSKKYIKKYKKMDYYKVKKYIKDAWNPKRNYAHLFG